MQPIVSVCIISYNHEKYIAQAIESALMQKTNYDYEIVIGEDCSTDRTREIVLDYKAKFPDKIKLLLQEKNVGMMKNFIDTLKSCSGNYIALCEGDDYWTDPNKLQKQVDFLETNPDYGMVHTKYLELNGRNNRFKKVNDSFNIPTGEIYEEVLMRPFICTLTMLIRTKLIKEFIEQFKEQIIHWVVGDLPLKIYISKHSKVKYLDHVMGVYRIHAESAIHDNDREKKANYFKGLSLIENFFVKEYGCSTVCNKKLKLIHNKRNFYISYLLDDDIEIQKYFKSIENKTLKDYLVYFYTINKKLRKPLNRLRSLWIAYYRKW